MSQNKLVCICSAYYYPHFGGVERYTENMAKYLVREGYKVVILTSEVGSKPGMEMNDNIFIYRLPVLKMLHSRYPLPAIFSREYRKLIKEFRKNDFSVFILNTRFYLTTLIGLFLSKQGNKNAIIIEHGTGHIKTGNFIIDRVWIIMEHVLTWFQRIFFKPLYFGVSEACNRWLLHFEIKANGVIYNGIDTEFVNKCTVDYKKLYKLSVDSVIFSFVGRLIKEKGIIFILDLFKEFVIKYPNAYLFVAGTGPLFEEAVKYNNENIFILGKLDHAEVMNLLSYTDVLLIPSDYPEGLPTLILEGGFSKCSVIATDRGGSKEVITDDHLGFVLPDLDHKKFLTAMEELMTNTDRRKVLQENLHQRVISKFSWKVIIQKVQDLLDKET